jgi:excisionase family DNA binding protein
MKRLLTSKEVAAHLSQHPETIRRKAREGVLRFIKLAGKYRFDPDDIQEFLEKRRSIVLPSDLFWGRMSPKEVKRLGKNTKRRRYPSGYRVFCRRTKRGQTWCMDYRDHEGQRRREAIKGCRDEDEARLALEKKMLEVFNARYQPKKNPGHLKFSELADLYLNEARKAKRSWKTDEWRLVRLREYFGEMEAGAITTSAILTYREARLKAGISELTTNRERTLLSVLFNFAIEKGLMSENPASKVRKFSERDTARDRVLSMDEEKRLFEELPPDLRPFVLAGLHSGLRFSELLNLRWADVDFERKSLRVEHTKSGKARFIPINTLLLGVLEKLRAEHQDGKLVFILKAGSVRTGFKKALQKAKIESLTFHDLRRSFGTRLLERGTDIITIGKLYGHSSVLVTQNYLHPRDELSREAVDLLVEGASKPIENQQNLAQNWHTKSPSPSGHPVKSAFSVN